MIPISPGAMAASRIPPGGGKAIMSRWSERIGTVGDWMTRNPAAVPPETPVGEVARLMRTEDIRHVLVVDGEALVGSPPTATFAGTHSTSRRTSRPGRGSRRS